MRRIEQPGPAPAQRVQWVAARGQRIAAVLEPGLPLLEAVRKLFSELGLESGVLRLAGGAFGPFAYVMPALSQTPEHAAFYSAAHRPAGVTQLRAGALTFGMRYEEPFFHCHALWTEADGRLAGGHVLPEETVVAEPMRVSGIGLDGAAFVAERDAETNFTLFGPVAQASARTAADREVYPLRLRPNGDLAQALELFCRERDIAEAEIHGGVGSIIGAHYEDGRRVEAFATEMAVLSGRIRPGPGGVPTAELDIGLVDFTGAVSEGRLARGENPVLMTVEAVLERCR